MVAALPAGRILVTGATGFIGAHLVHALMAGGRGDDVVATSRRGALPVDLRDAAQADRLVETSRPSVIFHLAGLIYSRDLDELYAANVSATHNLLRAVQVHAPTCRVVVPGSAAEYGRVPPSELPIGETRPPAPVVPYGLAKTWQTATAGYFASLGVRVVVCRLFNVVGPGAPAGLSVGAFAEQLRRIMCGAAPPRLLVGDLAPRRDFVDVTDACAALIALAALADASGVYNACRGTSISMREVLDMLVRESGMEVEVAVDPARLRHGTEILDSYGTSARLHQATGWAPVVPLRDSLARMLRDPSRGR